MKYIREFDSGSGGTDPRNKCYAVYECGACGHEADILVSDRASFIRRDRRCPACGAMDAQDLRKSLELERASLEEQHRLIQVEIDRVITKMDELPVEENA